MVMTTDNIPLRVFLQDIYVKFKGEAMRKVSRLCRGFVMVLILIGSVIPSLRHPKIFVCYITVMTTFITL